MNDGVVSKKTNPVVNVFLHEDGTVSVGLSGDVANPKFQRNRENLQKALDEKYGEGKYSVGSSTLDESSGVRLQEAGNMPGVCAEPKCSASAGSNPSPIVSMSTQWRGKQDNPHPYNGAQADHLGEHLDTEMNPCATCGHVDNAEVYMDRAGRNKE